MSKSSRSQMFLKIGVLKDFVNFTRKESLFLIKLPAFRLQSRWFRVKFAKFLRTPLFTELLRQLLLVNPYTTDSVDIRFSATVCLFLFCFCFFQVLDYFLLFWEAASKFIRLCSKIWVKWSMQQTSTVKLPVFFLKF